MLSRARFLFLWVSCTLGLTSLAEAATTATVFSQSGQNVVITGFSDAGNNVVFTVEPAVGSLTVVSAPVILVESGNNDVISSIYVTIKLPDLMAGTSRVELRVEGLGSGSNSVGNISRNDGASTGGELWVRNVEAVNGIGGYIQASRILRVATTTTNPALGDITADITETGSVISTGSQVDILAAGDILGDIYLETAADDIIAAGDIGTTLVPLSIIATSPVDQIEANSIYANIDLSDPGCTLRILEARAGNFVGAGTGIDGLSVRDVLGFGAKIEVVGDFDAEATINSLDVPFTIWGDLPSGRKITIADDLGLEDDGQITINNADNTSQWLGTVEVGNTSPITITANPVYGATAANLGGGSIGEASFYLHENSCVPKEGSSVSIRAPDLASILIPPGCDEIGIIVKLRFYGPVQIASGATSDEVVKVERYNSGTSSWDDVTTDFQATSAAATLPGSRIIEVRPDLGPGFWSVGVYRMSPFEEDDQFNIECKDVFSAPDVQDFEYIITIVDECAEWLLATFDMNEDELLTYDEDVGAWLVSPVDFTADVIIDEDDMGALLTAIEQFNE